jgi:hypothetical protein
VSEFPGTTFQTFAADVQQPPVRTETDETDDGVTSDADEWVRHPSVRQMLMLLLIRVSYMAVVGC